MKIFISWSGDRSKILAKSLNDWIPNVIQSVRSFMSEEDIQKGARWSPELAAELENARVGLICLTPENLGEPWVLFEAGALSKIVGNLVCPYLFDLNPNDITGPLSQFQATKPEKEDTKRLMDTINGALGDTALPNKQLDTIFDKWWPDLDKSIKGIPGGETKKEIRRTAEDMLAEILGLVREQTRLIRTPPSPFAGKVPSPPSVHLTPGTGAMTLIGRRPGLRSEEES